MATRNKSRRNERGQGLLESILVLPLLLFAFWALLYLCYWGSLQFFAAYQLEEALLCAVPKNQRTICQSRLDQKIRQVLLFKEKVRVQIHQGPAQLQGSVAIQVFKHDLRMERVLKLPLEKNL